MTGIIVMQTSPPLTPHIAVLLRFPHDSMSGNISSGASEFSSQRHQCCTAAFGKQIQEKSLIACLKSEQAPPSPTLSLFRHGDPFFEQARSEISIDQSFIHLNYCLANMDICQSVASSQPCECFWEINIHMKLLWNHFLYSSVIQIESSYSSHTFSRSYPL